MFFELEFSLQKKYYILLVLILTLIKIRVSNTIAHRYSPRGMIMGAHMVDTI